MSEPTDTPAAETAPAPDEAAAATPAGPGPARLSLTKAGDLPVRPGFRNPANGKSKAMKKPRKTRR